jgi:hypothetical protein
MRITKVLALVFLVGVITGAVELKASDPVGVYAVIEKVVLEPSDSAPQRIQVWGVFSITEGKPGDFYQAPQRGYLYFTAAPGKEEVTRKEWVDLKAIAGSGQGIGFGTKYNLKARFRKADEKPNTPDVYPLGVGITKVEPQSSIIAPLKAMLKRPQ